MSRTPDQSEHPRYDELKVEMQTRCVHCLREQYTPAVLAVSKGEEPCVWCGDFSKPMNTTEYREALWRGMKERYK